MLLGNLHPKNGDVNGTRNIVEKMINDILFLRVSRGCRNDRRLLLPRIPFDSGDDDFPITGFIRIQLLVLVCSAATTKKAQYQSFSGALGNDI